MTDFSTYYNDWNFEEMKKPTALSFAVGLICTINLVSNHHQDNIYSADYYHIEL